MLPANRTLTTLMVLQKHTTCPENKRNLSKFHVRSEYLHNCEATRSYEREQKRIKPTFIILFY